MSARIAFLKDFLITVDAGAFWLLHNITGRGGPSDFFIVFLANWLPYFLLGIFLILVSIAHISHHRKIIMCLTVFVSAFAARFLVVDFIRIWIHRPRPFLSLDITPLFIEPSFSFPSGHATFFFAFSFAIFLQNKKWGVWFLVASTLMALARVASGVHYLSDIAFGAIGGCVIAVIVVALYSRYSHRSHAKLHGIK